MKSINFILNNCRGIDFDYFLDQEFLKRAVVKELEIIGEASNYLSDELRAKYDTIEWRKIVGLRNRLIHEYYDINYPVVWAVINTELPKLKQEIEKIISELK